MPSTLLLGRDRSGQNAFSPRPEAIAFKESATLTANTEATFTIPRNDDAPFIVSFVNTPGSEVWYAFTPGYLTPEVAEVPAGATFAATTSEMNAGARTLDAGYVVSVITAQSNVSVSIVGYYAEQGN